MTRIDNKDKLQAELLEKVREGIKPSDLKKKPLKPSKKSVSPPPIVQSDEGYSSDHSDLGIPTVPPLPNQQKNLQEKIKALQRQLQVYQDFKEADLRIKEKLKAENQQLAQELVDTQKRLRESFEERSLMNKTIQELKNTVKTTAENKEPKENINPEPIKTFTCSECQQTKSQDQLSRVFGSFSFCLECSKKARQTATQQKQEPQPLDFTCHLCNKPKTETPVLMKLDSSLAEYLICQECKPLAKEFNEADLITDELWEKYPYSSASEILEKEFGIKSNKE